MGHDDDLPKVPGPRGSRRRERTRAELLAAARQVFARRGFHEGTLAEITETAGVGVGTFYLHFADKDAIFTSLLQDGLSRVRAQVIAAMQVHPQPTLPVAIRAILDAAYAQRDLFRIAVMGGREYRRFHARDMLVELFGAYLDAVPDLPPFTAEDRPLLAQLLAGMLLQATAWWFEHEEPDPATMTERVLMVMQRGFPPALFAVALRPPPIGDATT